MKPQIYWWKDRDLPKIKTLQAVNEPDGTLIDWSLPDEEVMEWQDRFAEHADDLILISFSDVRLQRRWLKLTAAQDYYFAMLPH